MWSRIALLLFVFSVVPARSDDDIARLFGMGDPDAFTLSSEILERELYVYVRLPRDYHDGDEKTYPVVYLLDGGILFPMLAPLQLMAELDGIAKEAVIVGISYGGLGYANGNLRETDYTAPADEPEYWGGADRYQRFLAEELLPSIEGDYRVDGDRSVVLGQSLGGQFVLYTALTRPDLFAGYVAVNPALHRNLPLFLDLEPAAGDPPARLMVAVGSEERRLFREPLEAWLTRWQAVEERPFELRVEALAGRHHATSAPAAYLAAMAWLFDGEEAD